MGSLPFEPWPVEPPSSLYHSNILEALALSISNLLRNCTTPPEWVPDAYIFAKFRTLGVDLTTIYRVRWASPYIQGQSSGISISGGRYAIEGGGVDGAVDIDMGVTAGMDAAGGGGGHDDVIQVLGENGYRVGDHETQRRVSSGGGGESSSTAQGGAGGGGVAMSAKALTARFAEMSSRELKSHLVRHGMDYSGCVGRMELVDLAVAGSLSTGKPPPPRVADRNPSPPPPGGIPQDGEYVGGRRGDNEVAAAVDEAEAAEVEVAKASGAARRVAAAVDGQTTDGIFLNPTS